MLRSMFFRHFVIERFPSSKKHPCVINIDTVIDTVVISILWLFSRNDGHRDTEVISDTEVLSQNDGHLILRFFLVLWFPWGKDNTAIHSWEHGSPPLV